MALVHLEIAVIEVHLIDLWDYFDAILKRFVIFSGRRSISAKHNTDIKTNPSSSLSKTYTSSKKEELMKVINEAKAKLENVRIRL